MEPEDQDKPGPVSALLSQRLQMSTLRQRQSSQASSPKGEGG